MNPSGSPFVNVYMNAWSPIPTGTFPTSGTGASGPLLSNNGANPTNYLLNNHIKNAGESTGWTMTGMLTVNKGYL